jgi:hypothetical protein
MDTMQVLQNLKPSNTFSITTQHYNLYGFTTGVGQDEVFVNNLHRAKELKDITISTKSF